MALANSLKKVFESVGKNTSPTYAVVAVATTKGIFRPIFTMMDKKENPETKKYAALREGLTEVIAIPTYLTCGWLAGKGAEYFSKVKTKEAIENSKQVLKFAGVCVAAVFIIPGLCSIFIKPFTERILNKNKKDDSNKLDVVSQAPNIKVQKTPISQTGYMPTPFKNVSIASFQNSEMRVG